jgi:hypothetical protein
MEAVLSIKREDLGMADFENVVNSRRIAPVHPGSVLLHDFIEPLSSICYKLARERVVRFLV